MKRMLCGLLALVLAMLPLHALAEEWIEILPDITVTAEAVESAMGVPRSLAAPQVAQEPFDAGLTAPQGQRQGFGTVPVKGAGAWDVAGLTGDDWGFRSSAKATGT